MRLHTRALLAILLILLPSGSDTASLPHGSLDLSRLGEDSYDFWWQDASSRTSAARDEFDEFDTFGDAFDPQGMNSRAVAAASFPQQPEAHFASRSLGSALAENPAHRSQAQASLVYQGPRQDVGPSQELFAANAAQKEPRMQEPAIRAQQEINQATPQRVTAAQEFHLRSSHPPANIEVVIDGKAAKLFGKRRKEPRDFSFQPGTSEQQGWILQRFRQLSQKDHGQDGWLDSPKDVEHLKAILRSDLAGQLRRDFKKAKLTTVSRRFQPYIVGNKLILFQYKNGLYVDSGSVYYVYALPINIPIQADDPFDTKCYVDFIGILKTHTLRGSG